MSTKQKLAVGGSYKRGLEQARIEYEMILARKIEAAISADRKQRADAEAVRIAAQKSQAVYREIILPCAEEPKMPVRVSFPSSMGADSTAFVLEALNLILGNRPRPKPMQEATGGAS